MAAVCAFLVGKYAPFAARSGIPEIKIITSSNKLMTARWICNTGISKCVDFDCKDDWSRNFSGFWPISRKGRAFSAYCMLHWKQHR